MNCLICDSDALSTYDAMIAPFIAYRVWNRDSFQTKLLRCASCDFAFSDTRLSDEDQRALYSNYRDKRYQSERERFEPWYTEEFNANLCKGSQEERRIPVANIFKQFHDKGITNVLDFGGDRGDLFADLIPGASNYVYDISGIPSSPGVTPIHSLEECRDLKAELIGCSNVLEHVSSPKEFMAQIRSITPLKCRIFVEVPVEDPITSSPENIKNRLAEQASLVLHRPRLAVKMLPFVLQPKVHEHINFFTLHSLRELVNRSGFTVTSSGLYGNDNPHGWPMAWCLAQILEGSTQC